MYILWLDVETTNTDPKTGEIIQLAGIFENWWRDKKTKKMELAEIDRFNIKLRPENLDVISPSAINTHGITVDQMLTFPPKEAGINKFINILTEQLNHTNVFNNIYLAGYNTKFDADFIEAEISKFGYQMYNDYQNGKLLSRGLFQRNKIDMLPVMIAAGLLGVYKKGQNFRLETSCEKHNIKIKKAHDAMSDIEATRELAFRFFGLNKSEYEIF